MTAILNKIDYDKHFKEFKRRYPNAARTAVDYYVESYDTIVIYLASGDKIKYNCNSNIVVEVDYIKSNEIHISKPRKRGRPSKAKTRDYKFTIRLNEEENQKLKDICDRFNLCPSEFVRYSINRLYETMCGLNNE